ncbi:hypothetical protein [Spirochaeta dissipatitropha]
MEIKKGADGSALIETVASTALGIILITAALQMFIFLAVTLRNTENRISNMSKAQHIIMILEKSMSDILIPFWEDQPEIRVIQIDSDSRQLSIPWYNGRPQKYLELKWNSMEMEIMTDHGLHRYELPSNFIIETNSLFSGSLSLKFAMDETVTTVIFPFGGRSLQ